MHLRFVLMMIFIIPGLFAVELTPENQGKAIRYIDALITKGMQAKRIKPGKTISDEEFLRRAYVDIAGRIPTLDEYERFISSGNQNKRNELIDELLDSTGYISHSHNYWMDTLRLVTKSRKTLNYSYKLWLRKSIQNNMPYDKFVRELVGAQGLYHEPENGGANGYYMRDFSMNMEIISNTMQIFLATSMVCAQCHDHPYKKWTQMDYYKLSAFIEGSVINSTSENQDAKDAVRYAIKKRGNLTHQQINVVQAPYIPMYEGVFKGGSGKIRLPSDYSYDDGKPNELINAGVPFGPDVNLNYDNVVQHKPSTIGHVKRNKAPDVNSRKHFADWITSPENPMFTKTIVNRLWDRVFGAPLIGDLLDMKESEMGKNPKLTAFLIRLMKIAKYDQKMFMSILYKTKAYQREAIDDSKVKYHFQAPVIKRLSSEQIWDSLITLRRKNPDRGILQGNFLQSNVVYDKMFSMTYKERMEYTAYPRKGKDKARTKYDLLPKVKLADNSYRASMYRSPRGVGTFLDIYGQSERQVIDAGVREATVPQALHLMNNAMYTVLNQNWLLHEKLQKSSKATPKEKIILIFKTVLSRKPNDVEMQGLMRMTQDGTKLDVNDLIWALANSNEFKIRR